ncbi:tRNA (adenosine(37)-N6)-threonylcarbamoyltransferase complex dimerization subunit type 1 TsaB [Zhouia amylolytica]|uniref:tRNA (adenosine(37)-N6)-threonylcarbamoyltransferase complex dimerization subunit type 1 TsaB n=1 Tax=Zhouia amylolytica TaxID=376730 RepID=UPI0020CC5F47|nr:tRNA (adenosine(37)-N6)-threonylcarbamoyltransferase complex dimerization subunit type 1 TsaB [Zhouia amylolytica]MCQ0110405.1 tRNA (adenosine(37)-N6)-threonylcarbamoyltransferase complex dimerization subunit type 1 TsaB [Zhouia amylolytica]
MATILNIETSSTNCSISIGVNGELISLVEKDDAQYSHSEKLHVFIKEALKDASLSFDNIDAISVSKGPGSYTGLRIGVSAAKGLCFSLDKPLIALNTLEALSHQLEIDEGVIIPLLDARRMEVYAAVFDNNHREIRATKAEIITEDSFSDYKEGKVYLLGPGAEKCKDVVEGSNVHIIASKHVPSAREMVKLSEEKFKINDFENVAYFEPYYLKDFVVTKPKKR